jgi:hypothetical protein
MLSCLDCTDVLNRPWSCGLDSQPYIKITVFRFDTIQGRYWPVEWLSVAPWIYVPCLQVMNTQHTVVYPSLVHEEGGMEVSQTSLELEATSGVFREGKLRLRCLATIFTLDRRSDETELTEDTPQIAPVVGPTAHHSLGKIMFGAYSVTQGSVPQTCSVSMSVVCGNLTSFHNCKTHALADNCSTAYFCILVYEGLSKNSGNLSIKNFSRNS